MSWKSDRARVAALSRSRGADDPDLIEARRDLAAARLEDHITKVVAEAPPLTAIQLDSLRRLLTAPSVGRELRRPRTVDERIAAGSEAA